MKQVLFILSTIILYSCVQVEPTTASQENKLNQNGLRSNISRSCAVNEPLISISPNPLTVTTTQSFTFHIRLTNQNSIGCADVPYYKYNLYPELPGYNYELTELYQHTPLESGQSVNLYQVTASPQGESVQPGKYDILVELGEGLQGEYYKKEVSFTVENSTPTCVRSNPSLTVNPSNFNGLVGDSFTYTMTLQDNNQNCEDSLYALSYQVLPAGFSSNITNHTLGSGESITVTRTINSNGAAMGNYEFFLRAQDANAETFNISDADFFIALTEPDPIEEPAAPVLDSAVRSNGNYVLTFSQPEGSLAPAGNYDTFINNVDLNDRDQYSGFTRTITGLDSQVQQCFKIQGRYTQLNPAQFPISNEICVAPEADTQAPTIPQNLSYSNLTANSLTISWSPSSDNIGVASYSIKRNGTIIGTSATLNYSDSNLSANTTYSYQVAANDAAGNQSAFSSSMNVTTSTSNNNTTITLNELRAFPGAQGYAKNTNGFRGGEIRKVTNLNNSGPGSLREAVSGSTPAYVIFEVAGYIDLQSKLSVGSNKYIAGQTAFRNGGQGITLRKSHSWPGVLVRSNGTNIVTRFLRFRPGKPANGDCCGDAYSILSGSMQIIDHNSFSWGSDEVVEFWGESNTVTDITFSNNIVAEPLTIFTNGQSRAHLIGKSDRITFLRNMYSNSKQRNPLIGGGSNPGTDYELVNNIIHNPDGWGIDIAPNYSSPAFRINIIGNKANRTSQTSSTRYMFNVKEAGSAKYYVLDNYDELYRTSASQSEWAPIGDAFHYNHQANESYRASEPFELPLMLDNFPILAASELEEEVLPYVGASLMRDAVDQRQVDNYNNNNGNNNVHTEESVGGYPSLAPMNQAIVDNNNDGIDDNWSSSYNINNNAGYPALELYLSELAGDFN